MAQKDDIVEYRGLIEESLPGATFRVRLENNHEILAKPAGKLRKNNIRLSMGDEVKVEMSTYDLTKGRITYRF